MKVVIIRGSVVHTKATYGVGDVVDIADKDAERLCKLGVAVVEDGGGKVEAAVVEDGGTTSTIPTDSSELDSELDMDNMTRDELAQQLSLRGIGFKPSASRDHLANLLRNHL